MPRRASLALRVGSILAGTVIACPTLFGCTIRTSQPPPLASPLAGAAQPETATPGPPATAVSESERDWAAHAVAILQTVDQAVQEYHAATALPAGSAARQQLQAGAYAGLQQALDAYQALWPVTQQIDDASVRDQFVFVMGNVGGFLTPSPDLAGDPPTLGDRIARSLQNAISTDAAVQPKLERLAAVR